MKDVESKKHLILKMAKMQYKFDKKILIDGKVQIKTKEQLAKKFKVLIESEVEKDEI